MALIKPLESSEVDKLFDSICKPGTNTLAISDLGHSFHETSKKLTPRLSHESNTRLTRIFSTEPRSGRGRDVEKSPPEINREAIDVFLSRKMVGFGSELTREEFHRLIETWNVPSLDMSFGEQESQMDRIPLRRRLRAFWSITGPKVILVLFVLCVQIGFGLWQLIDRVEARESRAAFGWGAIFAKAFAGLLYPTLFFMILSMSRYFTTYMRRFHYISKVANWDRVQSFHIIMAIVALIAATLHSIGHLAGTFLYGSMLAERHPLALVLMKETAPVSYTYFLRARFGWTGLVSLGLFWIIALLSTPFVRKRSYEAFQLGHLLMFPFIALMCVHGTAKLLQAPILGYWLLVPTTFVILERLLRLARSFKNIPARLRLVDDEMVSLTCKQPHWKYKAGQYVLIQVPAISFWQWHPFTISSCSDNTLELHIKSSGDWTKKLRSLSVSTDTDINVGIDGPFGAPSQGFFDYDRSIIIGSGVGITPFTAILTHLGEQLQAGRDPWAKNHTGTSPYLREESSVNTLNSFKTAKENPTSSSLTLSQSVERPRDVERASIAESSSTEVDASAVTTTPHPAHRVDFHWMVREKDSLLWFASLLNRVHDLTLTLAPHTLKLNIQTHITMRGDRDIATHVFRHLLDFCGTTESPYSALTGLKTRSKFGRPDLPHVLENFHRDMLDQGWAGGRVGVFFCGSPMIGAVLNDACRQMTLRSLADGSNIIYAFLEEVFG